MLSYSDTGFWLIQQLELAGHRAQAEGRQCGEGEGLLL